MHVDELLKTAVTYAIAADETIKLQAADSIAWQTLFRGMAVILGPDVLTSLGFDQYGAEHRYRFLSINKTVIGIRVTFDHKGMPIVSVNGVEVQPPIVTLGAFRSFLIQLGLEGVRIP